MNFAITWQWLSSIHESAEVRETGAKLKLAIGPKVLTQNVDEWSKTVSDDVRLSAYPLALWFASNWWRLRWEPLPNGTPDVSWRMAHEIAAAGYGYIWPQVLLASDGEAIHVWAAASPEGKPGPIKYLSSAHEVLIADEFERVLDDFFGGVIARLEAVGISHSPLHDLLAELSEERANQELTVYRRLEAIAGFDAGEGPASVLDQLERLVPQAGLNAAQEVATLCVSQDVGTLLESAVRTANGVGLNANPSIVVDEVAQAFCSQRAPAWARGKELASHLRRKLGLNGGPISDTALHDALGVKKTDLVEASAHSRPPFGLAVRKAPRQLTLHLRKRGNESVRFELARFLCDQMFAAADDRWLPLTDAKTSRQKAQRAFAAEFLCPIESLIQHLGSDFSDDAMDDAAHHFQVSPLAIQTQLVNNEFLSRSALPDFNGGIAFPYAVR
ncbi:MAG: hypothetical protein IPH76_11120 [Xanthomonadales bacterium]|nr:hypothetical protein [Xanthomonadales bacterium]